MTLLCQWSWAFKFQRQWSLRLKCRVPQEGHFILLPQPKCFKCHLRNSEIEPRRRQTFQNRSVPATVIADLGRSDSIAYGPDILSKFGIAHLLRSVPWQTWALRPPQAASGHAPRRFILTAGGPHSCNIRAHTQFHPLCLPAIPDPLRRATRA